jgi:hypothetical protein
MELQTTYKEVSELYPETIKHLEKEKMRSKAKNAKEPLSKFKFVYDWCVRIQASSLADIMSGKAHAEAGERRKMTLQQRVDDKMSRISVTVRVALGHTRYCSELKSVPPAIIEQCRRDFEEQIAEEKRIDSLTPEQREAETQAILEELRKNPGFTEIQVPIRRSNG